MIKCEVIFDGDKIIVNGKELEMDWHLEEIRAWDGEKFYNIEDAITYCMEQSNV